MSKIGLKRKPIFLMTQNAKIYMFAVTAKNGILKKGVF